MPHSINMKDSGPADPTFHLDEIMLIAIKLGNIRKSYRDQQARKESMNIIEALSVFALSSKQKFSGQV